MCLMYRKIKNPFLLAIVASARPSAGFTSILDQKIAENVNVAKTIRLFHDNGTAEYTKNAFLAKEDMALNVRFGSDSIDQPSTCVLLDYQSGDLFRKT